ncbi:MAG: class I SAM-dependent methyltransferase [Proteobacteria bacterium]|nr:class I SAM-dependent methyltransferase [Pseudomonadota bacterium]
MNHPSAADITALYQRHAAAWDKERGRTLCERPWLDRFRAALPSDRSVLDLGCGAGEPLARYLIEQGDRVTGVDSSPALIDIARRRFPNERWMTDDMRTVSFSERFGGILAWDSFFHLTPDDQRAMFPVFAAYAAPGAALMFTSGPKFGEAIGNYQGDALYHASLDAAEYRARLAEHGFRVMAHVVEDPTCGGHTIWLAKFSP